MVRAAAKDAWGRLISPSLEREIRNELTDKANEGAIRVFGDNLHQLLMQPPIRGKVTLGVDPGFRTGCKLAVVDETGKVLETGVGYSPAESRGAEAAGEGADSGHDPPHMGCTAIAIGNGTASKESEQFSQPMLIQNAGRGATYMMVQRGGRVASTPPPSWRRRNSRITTSRLRSAVSIARRMQDPLAELVKIDPKAIGVGQYQHDMKPAELDNARSPAWWRSCVNQRRRGL
ncbi:MAG: hypothetical protein ACLUHE_06770 [Christensenellales bacterium]